MFALSIQCQNMGLQEGEPRTGAMIGVVASALAYWVFAPFVVQAGWWLTWGTVLFCIVGLFRPSVSSSLAMASVRRMGPTLTSGLTATTPIFAAGTAMILLGERLTPMTAAGTLFVVAGIAVIALRPGGVARSFPLWALALPLGAAFFRALGHPITKLGYDSVASPFFAGLVSNTVSALVLLATLQVRKATITGGVASYRWFIAAGLINAASLYSLNLALAHGPLLVVAPIVASSPVFVMLLGLLVFRKETITWRTVATIALVVPGVMLVAMNGPG